MPLQHFPPDADQGDPEDGLPAAPSCDRGDHHDHLGDRGTDLLGTLNILRSAAGSRSLEECARRLVSAFVASTGIPDVALVLAQRRGKPLVVATGALAATEPSVLLEGATSEGDPALGPLQGPPSSDDSLVVRAAIGSPENGGVIAAMLPKNGQESLDAVIREYAELLSIALDYGVTKLRQRRLAKRIRLHRQGLERRHKLATLGELVAAVAHEVSNPLSGIIAFAELLLDDDLAPEQREAVELIRHEADRAHRVLRDVLAFARAPEPASAAADVNEVVQRVARLRALHQRRAGVALDMDLDPASPVASCAPEKLEQVILNLVINAEQALQNAAVRRVAVQTRSLAGAVEIMVADTGRGIETWAQKRIFDPFFSTKGAGEGTGLGLTIARRIVLGAGGTMRVSSQPNEGAVFTVTLPLYTVASSVARAVAGEERA
ncbi:MAG TPA: ATP-binding protein [Gemmatimonadaceae bacterium]|nr:ATP-binding protein [Gemmatimonadaceae bacterium]